MISSSFLFNVTANTEIYTLSLHDALPIFFDARKKRGREDVAILRLEQLYPIDDALTKALSPYADGTRLVWVQEEPRNMGRSEEHTSELQSRQYLVCRLLLEKKKSVVITLD